MTSELTQWVEHSWTIIAISLSCLSMLIFLRILAGYRFNHVEPWNRAISAKKMRLDYMESVAQEESGDVEIIDEV